MIKIIEFQLSKTWLNITILCYEPDNAENIERGLFFINLSLENKWLNIQLLYGLVDWHLYWK